MRTTLYHGTLKRYKDNILKNGFTVSNREDNYLGTGVYFYDDRTLSYTWALKKAKFFSDTPVVFKCDVEYDKLLDLTNRKFAHEFAEFSKELDDFISVRKNPYSRKTAATKATYYMNIYCTKYGYDIIKALLDCSQDRLREMGIIAKQEIQYCVRNVKLIKNIREVYSSKESNNYEAY